MLYDKRWDKTVSKAITQPDPFSLESLIAWLEKQNPVTPYDWNDCRLCLVGRYLTAHGLGDFDYFRFENGELRIAVAAEEPRTFGAALKRARAIAARS